MLPVDEAESRILSLIQPLTETETLPLMAATGRVLAQPICSPLDFPHWDNSAMDGYAVRHADVQQVPTQLTVIEEIPAGTRPQKTLQPGQAARIFTGAMVPEGADTIVMQENTTRHGDRVTVQVTPAPKAFVRQQGAFHRAGDPLLPAGIRLGGPEIAVLAAAQCPEVAVVRRPRVAIFSTGNELVTPDQPLGPGQIVDSNQYALAALVTQAGGVPVPLGIVKDEVGALRTVIAQSFTQADIVLSSGGVSVGDYDYVDTLLTELGATLHIRAVAVKPGKPLTVASGATGATGATDTEHAAQLYFGLPGNPVSSLVSFWRFVHPALQKLSGLAAPWHPTFLTAHTTADLRAGGQRETYLWGRVSLNAGAYQFTPAGGGHSSGNLVNLAQANGLAKLPVGTTHVATGSAVQVLQRLG
ncbi:MAG: gephyrin-like molybdotransferase Glp [Cyanobacteria bacterium P01_A01_bin.105]